MENNCYPTIWFVCKFCKRAFPRKKLLVRHKRQFNHKNLVESKVPETQENQKEFENNESTGSEPESTNIPKSVTPNDSGGEEIETINLMEYLDETDLDVSSPDQDQDNLSILEDTESQNVVQNSTKETLEDTQDNLPTKSNKTYKCRLCSIIFTTKSKLEQHRRIEHADTKPYNCLICDQSFSDQSKCRKHELTHDEVSVSYRQPIHNSIKQKLNPKRNEAIIATTSQKVKKQKSKDDGNEKVILEFKSSTDSVAGTSRSGSDGPSGRQSTKDKNVKCPYCYKVFCDIQSFQAHEKTHTSGPLFTCYFCDRPFSFKSSLRRHVQTLHSNSN